MWALRRASLPLRSREFRVRVSNAALPALERHVVHEENKAGFLDSPESTYERCLYFKGFCRKNHFSASTLLIRRGLSSQTGAESGDDDEFEDGFSELESEEDSSKAGHGSVAEEDDPISEKVYSSDEDDVVGSTDKKLEVPDGEADQSEGVPNKKRAVSELFKVISASQVTAVQKALDKWVEEGKEVNREEISLAMLDLRRYRMYAKALQFSEWLESSKTIDFLEKDYSSRVDLIARVNSVFAAEKYVEKIPVSMRGEFVYQSLLVNSVRIYQAPKAEEFFNKIKAMKTPILAYACDQMLLLYKKTDSKKIADVLLLMERENVKASPFTYKLLLDIKGKHGDITGMEQILETMKADCISPDMVVNSILVRNYVSAGLQEKAQAVLDDVEKGNLDENRHLCRPLIDLYADIGLIDDVARVWKVCEPNPRVGETIAAIDAFGKLGKIETAETLFENLIKRVPNQNALHYNGLLRVYARNKMLVKGKNLVKRMAESDCKIGSVTWDLVVKLYVACGEIEKADSVLEKASQLRNEKPKFSSFILLMDQYANRGDIHNAEKIYLRLKQADYTPRHRQFQTLVKAYVTAKAPFYGVRDRMKADNISPNKFLLAKLPLVDAFRKTAVSDFLE